MDYAPFFTQSPQPFFGMAMAPTPSYSGEDKIGPTVGLLPYALEETIELPQTACGEDNLYAPHLINSFDNNIDPASIVDRCSQC